MSENPIGIFADMMGRNMKVAVELLPSAFSGFVLHEGKRHFSEMRSGHTIQYNWMYDNFGNPEFMNLYKKAKKGQWDSDDLAWDTNVDPENMEAPIFPEKLQPMYGQDFYQKLSQKERIEKPTGEKKVPFILVVEDSLTTRELEKNILESAGYKLSLIH
ncbi:MAG: hypothetical protein N3A69_08590, partial [Leptospiraceae bacterium]|nr:hypothetical protein [Leptospiraceae bacterium]